MDSDPKDLPPRSWGQRHALTIMLVVMAAMLALVIVVQIKT